MNGPCAKQRVIAVIITPDGERFSGENFCENPQIICPRGDMPSGIGYHLCKEVCNQKSHAEISAISAAGEKAKDSTLFLYGHTYACESCKKAADVAGILKIVIMK